MSVQRLWRKGFPFFLSGECSGAELFHVHQCFIDQVYRLAARPDVLAETVSRDLWQRRTEPIHQVIQKALLFICSHYESRDCSWERFSLVWTSSATSHVEAFGRLMLNHINLKHLWKDQLCCVNEIHMQTAGFEREKYILSYKCKSEYKSQHFCPYNR